MSTEAAQRRLLEALGDLRKAKGRDIGMQTDPLAAFIVGVHEAVRFAESMGEPDVGKVYRAFADLAAAVQRDLTPRRLT